MAHLTHEDGTRWTRLEDVARELEPLGVRVDRWPVEGDAALRELLARPALDDAQKERVLAALEHRFDALRAAGYRSRDLVVLHPDTPGLDELMRRFETCHTHSEDELRYVVAGEGVFGFVRPDANQVELLVAAGEYVNVPAGTEHWFHLTPARRIAAVRYFTDTQGWTPHYTGTAIRFAQRV